MSEYETLIQSKLKPFVPTGIRVSEDAIHPRLFPFQRAVTRWALRMGRAAIFAGTGLGKTSMQLEWAQQVHLATGGSVLIYAPLAVAEQTIAEGKCQDAAVIYADHGEVVRNGPPGLWVTNYDRFHHFRDLPLAGVIADEASIMKSHDGKTRNALIEQYREVPFRLVATATPAPNDVSELAGYSEFLGYLTRAEMLATFFINTGMTDQKWRLKKHAEVRFAQWLASWAVYMRKPSDIGFSDEGYVLPQLNIIEDIVQCEAVPEGFLFSTGLSEGIVGRAAMRRSTLEARVARAVEVIHAKWKTTPTISQATLSDNGSPSIGKSGIAKTEKSYSPASDRNGQTPLQKIAKSATVADDTTEHITSATEKRCSPTSEKSEPPESLQIPRLNARDAGKSISETEKHISPNLRNTTKSIPRRDASTGIENTASPLPKSTTCMPSGEESATFVAGNTPSAPGASSSTIVTKQISFEDYSAGTATLPSGCSSTTPPNSARQQNTSIERWVVWCGLNSEQQRITTLLGKSAVSIDGTMSNPAKLEALQKWLSGECPVLATKPSIFGYGLNWAFCQNVLFLGLSDSWEDFYQAIRRCWRFGQQHPVNVHIVISEAEMAVLENVKRKELEATRLGDNLVAQLGDLNKAALEEALAPEIPPGYHETRKGDGWVLHHGDCVEVMRDHIPDNSIHLSVFSPPFATLYTYSDNPRDMGNSASHSEFWGQFEHAMAQLYRITMPGRLACLHVAQITTTLVSDGIIGLNDFRGETIAMMKRLGWTHYREVTVDKDPQVAAARTKSKNLMFKTLRTDRSWTGPALADHILLFKKPGENAVPIVGGPVTNELWIKWARPVWTDIRETDTLSAIEAKGANDEKHICCLQLGVIERCVQLWSNENETVFSPFAGVGSEIYQALLCNRRGIGIELKPEYYATALKNLRRAEMMRGQQPLFAGLEEPA